MDELATRRNEKTEDGATESGVVPAGARIFRFMALARVDSELKRDRRSRANGSYLRIRPYAGQQDREPVRFGNGKPVKPEPMPIP